MTTRWLLCLLGIGGLECGSSGSDGSDGGVDASADGVVDSGTAAVTLGPSCEGNDEDISAASIAVDGTGNALVAWTRQVGAEPHVVLCTLRDGAWRSADLGAGTAPFVALDAAGEGMILWTEPDGSSSVAAPFVDGELGVTTAVPRPIADGNLAMLPDGDAVVLAPSPVLAAYRHDAQSDTWDPDPQTFFESPDVIVSSRLGAIADGLIAVWQDLDPVTGESSMKAAAFDAASGQWTITAELAAVADFPAGRLMEIGLGTSSRGDALVVLQDAESRDLSASAYDMTADRWSQQVVQDDAEPSAPLFPSGGVDASGRAWVAWAMQPPLADAEIRGRRFSGGWAETETLQTTFYASSVAITVADAGPALLVWIAAGAPDMELHASVADPDGSFGEDVTLLRGFQAEVGSLRVRTGPNGQTVAAWLQTPGGMRASSIDW